MATKIRFLPTPIIVLILTIFLNSSLTQSGPTPTYNVLGFGAKSDGRSDCTKSFLSAWAAACASVQPSTIYVPPGRYLIGAVEFSGIACKSSGITLRIDGTLVAPSDYNVLGRINTWIKFERTNGLSILGGTIDGQGAGLWACKNTHKHCPRGTQSLGVYNSNNVLVNGLTSLNSQFFHIIIDGCNNIRLIGMTISAPAESPNTDGIHVQSSSGVTIMNSHIATGDDCISLGPGCSNVWAESINCGPGHGISIGSLGSSVQEPGVQNVTVRTVTFTGTLNGLRIKTWAKPSNGFVRGVLFQHATMVNVQNPIIIDQNYCAKGTGRCSGQASGVRISDVTYQDIHGTSATQVAVDFDCSKKYPCSGITLQDVHLSYQDQPATASCVNAGGTSAGLIDPRSCL
ncbi:OLC1v1007903C1 [Oldenlandia corymbosa var. corymbosa]|uniref:OLC1v1007903C1 n=1 Tax=Oldenlandia corymbosa var. corymbosa TaxID=529605 RepID=A0AAV1DKV1_OLDCO|nr:OLC1v1007903C1 [Oldenlandia corymbosa var. corymbosa]